MLYGEYERLTTKQLRCILYDCRDQKYIPYKCLLPTGIHRMKKFDLLTTIRSLEYFIPTFIVVNNKYDKVNKQLLLNYLDTKVENGSYRLRNKTREYLDRMLEVLGDSNYNVLQYAIDTDLRQRTPHNSFERSILPYVDKKDIQERLKYHERVIDSLVVCQSRIDNYYYTDFKKPEIDENKKREIIELIKKFDWSDADQSKEDVLNSIQTS